MPRNAEVPPQREAGEAQYQPFWLREKTKEMLHYGYTEGQTAQADAMSRELCGDIFDL